MADKKISELDAITGANTAADDYFVVVDTSGSVTKKISRAELNNAIEQDVLAQVSITDLGSDLNTNGNDINFGDNDKATFGSGDLEIYHTGSDSLIAESGAGRLKIQSDGLGVDLSSTTGELMLRARTDNAVELYYDNQIKLTTTASGIDVTGNATFADNGKAIFGAGSNLQIYYDGTDSVIKDRGAGNLVLTSNGGGIFFRNDAETETFANFNNNGSVQLRHNNETKFETTASGIDVTGTVTAQLLDLGTNNPRIRFDDSDTSNNGEITLDNTSLRIEADEDNAVANSKISLRVDGSEKAFINSSGLDVTGIVTAGGLSVDGGTIKLDGNHPTGTENVAVGDTALDSVESGGQYNVAVGSKAGTAITTGAQNVAVGAYTLDATTTGDNNTAVGKSALGANTTASDNTAVGTNALLANTTGDRNVAIGSGALDTNTVGDRSVAVGYHALTTQNPVSNQDMYNTAVGYGAMAATATGRFNTAIGGLALDINSTGSYNTALGYLTLSNSATASNNTALGSQALQASTTGYDNTAIGRNAGNSITTGFNNSIVGSLAGDALTIGNNNVAVGMYALSAEVAGDRNVALGYGALNKQTNATTLDVYNTAVGFNAGTEITDGRNNTAIGGLALDATTTGDNNTAVGLGALGANISGASNTAVGLGAGSVMTGDNNTLIGRYNGNQHGLDMRTANNRIVISDGDGIPRMWTDSAGNVNFPEGGIATTGLNGIGMSGVGTVRLAVAAQSSFIMVGRDSAGTSDKIRIEADGDVKNINNSYGSFSDRNLKQDIVAASSQWDDIKAVQVKNYRLIDEVEDDESALTYLGVVAQDLEASGMNGLVKETPKQTSDGYHDTETVKTVKYSILYMKAVKALQEAMERIETLEAKVAEITGE